MFGDFAPFEVFRLPRVSRACRHDASSAFTVRHFAGDVEYAVDDFLKKNAETMEVMTRQLLATPALAFLQATYDDAEETRAEREALGDADTKAYHRDSSRIVVVVLGTNLGNLGHGVERSMIEEKTPRGACAYAPTSSVPRYAETPCRSA